MDEAKYHNAPRSLPEIESETERLGFSMPSESRTGALLRTLAASKSPGAFLDLGTGTGLSAAWILDGMDVTSRLDTVDNEDTVQAVAKHFLGGDPRITFHTCDAADYLSRLDGRQFDFLFADAWPGKFTHLELALAALKPSGLYIIDDLLPKPSWSDEHQQAVTELIALLEQRDDFVLAKCAWSTGIIIAAKKA